MRMVKHSESGISGEPQEVVIPRLGEKRLIKTQREL